MTKYGASSRRVVGGVLVGALVCALSGCRGGQRDRGVDRRAEVDDGVVARVGKARITVADVQAELDRLPPSVRMRFSSKERRVDLLNSLVQLELLAQEARRQGLDRGPEVIRRKRRALVDEVARVIADEEVRLEAISESDVQEYYRTHQSRFVRPATATRAESIRPIDEVRAQVQNELLRQRRGRALRRVVDQLRARAKVEVVAKNLDRAAEQLAGAQRAEKE